MTNNITLEDFKEKLLSLPAEQQGVIYEIGGRVVLNYMLHNQDPDCTEPYQSITPTCDALSLVSGMSRRRFRQYEKQIAAALENGTLEEFLKGIGFSKLISTMTVVKCLAELGMEREWRLEFEASQGTKPPEDWNEFEITLAEIVEWCKRPVLTLKTERRVLYGNVCWKDFTGVLLTTDYPTVIEIPFYLMSPESPRPKRGDKIRADLRKHPIDIEIVEPAKII